MTNYGTIPSSSIGSPSLEYLSRAKQILKAGLSDRRSWKVMFNLRSIGIPAGTGDAFARIKTNISYFQMNYAIVILVILFLSLLWHPFSLIVYIVMMAAWIFLYFLRDEPLVLFGRTIDDRVILALLSAVTIFVLLFTNATMNILVSLAVGVFVVLLHAALRKTDDLYLDEESSETGGLLAHAVAPSSSS